MTVGLARRVEGVSIRIVRRLLCCFCISKAGGARWLEPATNNARTVFNALGFFLFQDHAQLNNGNCYGGGSVGAGNGNGNGNGDVDACSNSISPLDNMSALQQYLNELMRTGTDLNGDLISKGRRVCVLTNTCKRADYIRGFFCLLKGRNM